MFEKVFFSEQSKRLDLQLTSELHKEEQELYRASNLDHEIFKSLKRVQVEGSIIDFKKQSGMHPDTYKASYAQFLNNK
jgi:hypothetical protein